MCKFCVWLPPTKIITIQIQIDSGRRQNRIPWLCVITSSIPFGIKLIFNSTISDALQGARFMSCHMKCFFLETPMSRADYMRIHSNYLPTDIRDQYQIDVLIEADGYIYIKTIKWMYGLNQASIISYNQTISHMDPHRGKILFFWSCAPKVQLLRALYNSRVDPCEK